MGSGGAVYKTSLLEVLLEYSNMYITGVYGRLDGYNITPGSTTVSGLSSGAAFATQFHVAYSSQVRYSTNGYRSSWIWSFWGHQPSSSHVR